MPYVETVMLTVQFAQDEILLRTRLSLISSYLFCSWTRFPCPDFHRLLSLIRTTHYGRVWSWNFFQYHQLPSCPWVVQRNVTSSRLFANELVPRVMALLVGNHVDLPDRETCHVSLIDLFLSFQMLGPIAYKQFISIVTLFISEISFFNHSRLRSSSRSILRPQLSQIGRASCRERV